MNLSQRVNRFLIGILIGVLLSIVFFSDRGCSSWVPENMVLGQLKSYYTQPDSTVACRMDCLDITEFELADLFENGDVRISESQPRATPRKYKIYATRRDDVEYYIIAAINLQPDLSRIIEVGLVESEPECDCP